MDPQIIKTDGGEELVVLSRRAYDRLRAQAMAGAEEAEIARVVDASDAALAAGREVELPAEVALAIARGQSPLLIIRRWRGLTQSQLAAKASVEQAYISGIERGARPGSVATLRRLAEALSVPLDLLAAE